MHESVIKVSAVSAPNSSNKHKEKQVFRVRKTCGASAAGPTHLEVGFETPQLHPTVLGPRLVE